MLLTLYIFAVVYS